MDSQNVSLRVVLADDHPIVRAGIRAELQAANVDVVGEAIDGETALRLTQTLQPDVLVLDVEMPGLNGLAVCRQLNAAKSEVRILVLSAHDHAVYVYGLLEAGATGYILKDEAPDTIVQAVFAAARGALWLSPSVAYLMRQRAVGHADPCAPALSERDVAILREIVDGRSNAEIADVLGVQEQTAKNYVSCLYRKLDVHSRVEAALWATKHGFTK